MDSLEGMPEFDKPENIPLVVPDLTPARPKHLCIATTKAGKLCGFPKCLGTDYCVPHNPAITEAQRQEWRGKRTGKAPRDHFNRREIKYKSREDLLSILSSRFDKFLERFGDTVNVEVEQVICDMARTYCAVLKVETEGEVKAQGWRMKGSA
jgi:hypothetical protein